MKMINRLCFRMRPDKRNMYYQLKNIDIEEIGKIIFDENEKSFNEKCLKECGWILKKDDGRIRELMNERLEEWINEEKEKMKKERLLEKLRKKKKDVVEEEEMDMGIDDEYMMEEFVGGHKEVKMLRMEMI